jgi:cell division protein FtsL
VLARKNLQTKISRVGFLFFILWQKCEYGLGILFFTFVGLFLAWKPIQVTRLIRDIRQLHKLKTEMVEINARLNLEKATLTRLDRIEERARREFGFVDPDESQVIDFTLL